jgi:hypothetical protein
MTCPTLLIQLDETLETLAIYPIGRTDEETARIRKIATEMIDNKCRDKKEGIND